MTSTALYDEIHGLSLDLIGSNGSAPTVVSLGSGFADPRRAERERLLAACGLSVASVTVRDPAESGYAAAVEDVQSASTYLLVHADELGLASLAASRRLGLTGVSRGGWLAALVALTAPATAAQPVIGAVSPWSAPTDLWTGSRRSGLEARVFGGPRVEEQLAPAADDETLRSASPINGSLADAPPFLFVYGDRDIIVPPEHSRWLHEALQRNGRESALIAVGGVGHDDAALDAPTIISAVASWFTAALP
ncbi:MAG: alpha/beta hydrolase [Microbacteriaceae bacterium]|nr:alpha/beta hydrolase [Microbacteriaceae bacterium]